MRTKVKMIGKIFENWESKNKYLIILLVFLCTLNFSFGNNRVNNIDKSSKGLWKYNLTRVWEVSSAGPDLLVNVKSLVVDEKGNLYFIDRKHMKIFVFNSNGQFLRVIGKRGEGPGEYLNLFNIYLKDNTIIAQDSGRFHYFEKSGKFLETQQATVFPVNMTDRDTYIYSKPKKGYVFKIDLLSMYNNKIDKTTVLTEIAVPDPIVAGTMRYIPPAMVAVGNKGIFYGDWREYLIKKWDFSGKKKIEFTIKNRKRKKVSNKTKRKKWESFPYRNGFMPEDMVKQAMKSDPDYAPFYNGIIANDGFIYVMVADPEKAPLQQIDVFSDKGEYIYSSFMNFPKGLNNRITPVFKGKYVYVFAEDQEGTGKLIKYKADFPKI